MSNELSIYDRINDPMAAVKQLGHAIASSGMFGAGTPAQGEIFALECLVRRMPPLMLAEKYHVIFGKLSKKAGAMLADFNQAGGDHHIVERTADLAWIQLVWKGEIYDFKFSWEEALGEPFVYEPAKGQSEAKIIELLEKKTPPPLKAKYRTPRSRMQMLWARVVSDGVSAVWPGAQSGTYTPEEIEDFPENANARPKRSKTVDQASEAADSDAEIVDGEIVPPAAEPAAQAASEAIPFDVPGDAKPTHCTADQSAKIVQLFGLLEATPEDRREILASRGVETPRQLPADKAAELIDKLQAALDAKDLADTAAEREAIQAEGESPAELTAWIREQLASIDNEIVEGLAAKLRASGMQTLDDLKRDDAYALKAALQGNNLQQYLAIAVWYPAK